MDVLLVDDDSAERFLVRHALDAALSCEVVCTEAASLTSALIRLQQQRFDVILTELHLPDADGLSAPRQLGHAADGTPIIVMLGVVDETVGLQAVAQGAQDYLAKDHVLSARGDGLERVLLRRAVRHAIERHRLRRESRYDALTGALNRRGLREVLQAEVERAQRQDRALHALFIDCDNFKRINDTHGYDAGDATLRRVGQVAREQLRPTDALARFGGDEFVVLLPATTATAAQRIAQRLREQIEQTAPYNATVSIGLVEVLRADTTVDALVRRAQCALNLAKRSGKNQVFALTPSAEVVRYA